MPDSRQPAVRGPESAQTLSPERLPQLTWRRGMALAGERGLLVTRRLRRLGAELDTRKMAFSQWDIQHDTIG